MIDLLIGLGIGASFVVFAICLWLLKRELKKSKKAGDANVPPPKLPHD